MSIQAMRGIANIFNLQSDKEILRDTLPPNLQVITSFNEFQELRNVWNRLLEQSCNDKVFLTHEWFTCWWQAFGKNKNLFILLVKDSDEIIGIAPLVKCRRTFRGLPVRSIEFMANDDSPACGFIIKKDLERVMLDLISFLIKDFKKWDIIFFKNMLVESGINNSILKALNKEKKRHLIRHGLISPYLKTNSEWETYFKSLSAKRRKTIRNVCNRVKRLGNITVKENNNGECFNEIIFISEKGWKYKKGKAFINRKDRKYFFELLSEVASKNGWLSIWCMYKDNEPIAYEYHLRYKKNDTALLSEFNSDFESFSPGAYLDYEIVKSLFSNGIYEYDMCGSQDEYKKKWTNEVRDYKNLIIFNDSAYGRLLYFLEEKPIKFIKKLRDKLLYT